MGVNEADGFENRTIHGAEIGGQGGGVEAGDGVVPRLATTGSA
jgi:hypothetical protein